MFILPVLMLVSFLVFLRVYGPSLITALIQEFQEKQKRAVLEQTAREDAASHAEVVSLNEQLSRAFGASDESRQCEISLRYYQAMRATAKLWLEGEVDEDAPTELYVDVAWCDEELDVVLADETLTASEKCTRICELLDV